MGGRGLLFRPSHVQTGLHHRLARVGHHRHGDVDLVLPGDTRQEFRVPRVIPAPDVEVLGSERNLGRRPRGDPRLAGAVLVGVKREVLPEGDVPRRVDRKDAIN